MLTRLFIRNIGLMKSAEILPAQGLTVITGETGAGKSMLIDALALCLGERADASLLRSGAEEGSAEATFDVGQADNTAIQSVLHDNGVLLDDGDLTLRRSLPQEGASKAFANGARMTITQLQDIGERLADIHGQHEHQMLLNANRHGEMLDRFGKLKTERTAVHKTFSTWKKLSDNLKTAQERLENQAKEEDLLKAWLEELSRTNYNEGEEEKLSAERLRLMSTEQIGHALAQAVSALSPDEAPDAPNLLANLAQAERAIQAVADKGGEAIHTLAERFSAVYNEIEDIQQELTNQLTKTEPDPLMLDQVDNRLHALRDLARKHGVAVYELPEFQQKLAKQYEDLSLLQEGLEDLEKHTFMARTAFEKACKALSQRRKEVSKSLGKSVEKVLKDLHMPNALFVARLDDLHADHWNANGAEKVNFMISTNPGQSLQPLVKIASGGEVSRLMLALKVVFYQHMPPMTLVFDEIDTGLGGAVADAVGDALSALSSHHQVFAITHQPQVAAKGQAHIKIEKLSTAKTAQTVMTTLDDTKRKEELARMLSGRTVTPEARAAAGQLLRVVK